MTTKVLPSLLRPAKADGAAVDEATPATAHDTAWQTRSVQAAGLAWRVAVAGAGPDLVLLHGTGASLESWQACAERLATKARVIVPDLPGHASTSLWADGRASLPRMASALEGLINAMALRPALVIGHSAGAALALQWTLDRARRDDPSRPLPSAVVGVNGALQPLPGWSALVFPALAWGLAQSRALVALAAWHAREREAVRRLIAATGSTLPEPRVAQYQALLRNEQHVQGVLAMMAGWRLEGLLAGVPGLKMPIHLVTGLKDRTVPPLQARTLASNWPQVRLTERAGLGHLMHEEDPAWTSAFLLGLVAPMTPAGDDPGP
jgi:magnesium chelatase accessory protein